MNNEISSFYCCLNIRERTIILNTCEGLALTLMVGIPVPVWDAFWVATGYLAPIYKELFRACYRLETASVEIDGTPTDVVRPVGAFVSWWASAILFVVTPSAACLDGCSQSTIN